MNYLSIDSLTKTLGDKVLFKNISFGISRGQKIALVGINGSGKSTLLKTIIGEIIPDQGQVSFRKGITIGLLSQNPYLKEEETVWEAVFDVKNQVIQVIRDYEHALENTDKDPTGNILQKCMEKMDALDAWDYETKFQQILGKLGIHHLDQKIGHLSGGQKKRVALAKILIEAPDFIILDEPTNHLDIQMIEWLENYLSTQDLTLLLVTHDRYFLDKVANQIIELDRGAIWSYAGNYSYFLEKKAEREQRLDAEIDKARNLMRKELDWIRRQPKARGTKAKYRVDAFEDLKEKAALKKTIAPIEFNVKTTRQGSKILEIDHITKSFPSGTVIEDFSYTFKKMDRIGIVGKNGAGKSTFLNMMTGKMNPDKGSVVKGDTIVFGYYGQEEAKFKENQRVIDVVKEIADVIELGDGTVVTASKFLEQFQFTPPQQYDFTLKLSGGEKRRLQLLLVLIKNPNFLILDEPTNDLDIATLNILEDFLTGFKGCLVLVSHDRYFMDRLVEHLFVFEGEGKIKDFPGNYTDYREYLEELEGGPIKETQLAPKQVQQANGNGGSKKKASFQEKKEFETLEAELARLESQKQELIEKLNSGATTDHSKLSGWSMEIEKITKEIEKKSDRWIELSDFV